MKKAGRFKVDENGFYGSYGGAFIPEMLYPNVRELQENYRRILDSSEFLEEYSRLLKDYAGRPSPLYHAANLSKRYACKIYLKREDLLHTGAHKINNTLGQILLAKALGKKRIIAETGAGQHGVATATVCALMGFPCVVYMGTKDMERQKPNVGRMRMLGAEVRGVSYGSKTLKDATNEAIRDWIDHPVDTHYIIGSVVGPHPYPDLVARLQSVISREIRQQLSEAGELELPDAVIACVGGGSNAAGAFYHFLEEEEVELIAVEAAGLGINTGKTAATTAKGSAGILHASRTLLMQTEDGQVVEPHSISAGLDYPGIGPLFAHLWDTKRARFEYVSDQEALDAAMLLAKSEGIIPALESAHAVGVLEKLEIRDKKLIIINLSGRGDKDLDTYLQQMDI